MYLTLIHICLWALWFSRNYYEIQTDPRRRHAPSYATASAGDLIGFSTIVYAASTQLMNASPTILLSSVTIGICCSFLLHAYWHKQSHWQTGSMYGRTTTLAGYLHNIYVTFIATTISGYLILGLLGGSWYYLPIFLVGIAIYIVTMFVDSYRGLI